MERPALEICSDGVDQDCDGTADNPFGRLGPQVRLTASGRAGRPDAAGDDGGVGIVWRGAAGDPLLFTRLAPGVPPTPVAVVPGGRNEAPALAATAGGYALAWSVSDTSGGTQVLLLLIERVDAPAGSRGPRRRPSRSPPAE